MSNLIDILNHTSGPRTIFYCVVGLIALAIIADGLANLVRSIRGK